MQDDEPARQVVDYGCAVLIDGSAQWETKDGGIARAQRLEAIAPLSRVLGQETSRFALQTNVAASSHLSRASIYLSPGSEVVSTLIDAGANLTEGLADLRNRSKVGFDSGEIFILHTAGSWVYQVDFDHASASLIGSGRGGIGIADSRAAIEVDCLLGVCEITTEEDANFVLQARQSIPVFGRSWGEKTRIPTETMIIWNALCGGCLGEWSIFPLSSYWFDHHQVNTIGVLCLNSASAKSVRGID